ncbi:MAG: hypothetical protein JNJ46_07460 [Myxococcales bacterium]|nr:hypothetical protein [Myxococcales bacterium]
MALSKTKIIDEINAGMIIVGPNAQTRARSEELRFDTVSLELHMRNDFKVWKTPLPGDRMSVDPSADGFDLKAYGDRYTELGALETDGCFLLKSQHFVICTALEYVKLPAKYFARVEGKSKLARLGISIHNTAPTIQSGWDGHITFEIYNHSPIAIRLKPGRSLADPGLGVAQLIFEEITGDGVTKERSFSSEQDSPLGRSSSG